MVEIADMRSGGLGSLAAALPVQGHELLSELKADALTSLPGVEVRDMRLGNADLLSDLLLRESGRHEIADEFFPHNRHDSTCCCGSQQRPLVQHSLLPDYVQTMDISDIRRTRLRQWIDTDPVSKGDVEAWCAYYSGFVGKDESPLSPTYIRQLVPKSGRGARNIGERTARRLERIGSKPAGWLDFLQNDEAATRLIAEEPAAQYKADSQVSELSPIAVWEHPDELPDGLFIKVPRLHVHLSAGNGHGEHLDIDLERNDPQVFRAEWVRRERLKPGALASMYARGTSMEPRICDGDSLLVDTSQQTIIDGKVYAVWYAGELRVKRLYKRIDGGITIHSDNERDFPRMEVTPDQMEHVRIIGRVVHMQGTGGL